MGDGFKALYPCHACLQYTHQSASSSMTWWADLCNECEALAEDAIWDQINRMMLRGDQK